MTNIITLHNPESNEKYIWNFDLEEFQINGEYKRLPENLKRFREYTNSKIIGYLECPKSVYSEDDEFLTVENIDCYTLDV